MLTGLAANRNVLKNLVIRDLQRRYVGSIGGFFWSVIHPIVQLACYSFVFGVIMPTPIGNEFAGYNYPIFILCGLLPWLFFSETITRNCASITENSVLVTKTVIPAEILPLSITLSSLIQHAIGLIILLAVLGIFFQLHLSILFIFIYLPIMVCLAQGLGWILAGLQVFLRDTIQALQIFIWLWFWFTPIVYTLNERVPSTLKAISRFNPMAVIITGYRNALLNHANPNITEVAIVFAMSLAIFVVGALLFRQAKPGFADVL